MPAYRVKRLTMCAWCNTAIEAGKYMVVTNSFQTVHPECAQKAYEAASAKGPPAREVRA